MNMVSEEGMRKDVDWWVQGERGVSRYQERGNEALGTLCPKLELALPSIDHLNLDGCLIGRIGGVTALKTSRIEFCLRFV